MAFETVIGLEVHAQLSTRSKIFCACSTAFGAAPNENTCPVCTGMPGVLPVLNRKAVEFTIRTAIATSCAVQRMSAMIRKFGTNWARLKKQRAGIPKRSVTTNLQPAYCPHRRFTNAILAFC